MLCVMICAFFSAIQAIHVVIFSHKTPYYSFGTADIMYLPPRQSEHSVFWDRKHLHVGYGVEVMGDMEMKSWGLNITHFFTFMYSSMHERSGISEGIILGWMG